MAHEHVDEQALTELKSIMGDDFKLLIDTFINDSMQRIVAIEEAISASDAEALRSSAHSFKGSALNIAAGLLTEYCKTLEYMGRDGEIDNADSVFENVKTEFEHVKDFLLAL